VSPNPKTMHQVTSKLRVLTGSVLVASAFLCSTSHATILWDGDANNGTGVFGVLNIENNPGQINVVTDSTYGKVFQMICYDNGSTKVRTEGSHMAGFQPVAGGTYYFGWRHKWGPLPTLCGKWQVLEQIHLNGSTGPVPFGLHVDGCDTNMHWQYNDPSGTSHDFLVQPFPLNSWHSFVYHEKWSESETDGYVEVWYDGNMKTLTNGSTRYPAAWCFSGELSYWKWGVYRSGSGGPIGTSYAYLWRPRAATTFTEVDPLGGTGGGGTFSGFYKVIARHSGKAIVVQSASLTDSAPVVQYTYGGTATNDEWQLIKQADGAYEFANRNSGKAMVVQSASLSDGALIIQYTFGGSNTNDEWDIVDVGGGYYELKNHMSGKALEVPGGSTTDGVQLDQRTYSGATYQQFQLTSVP
jgi:hypothetical protein